MHTSQLNTKKAHKGSKKRKNTEKLSDIAKDV